MYKSYISCEVDVIFFTSAGIHEFLAKKKQEIKGPCDCTRSPAEDDVGTGVNGAEEQ